MSSISGTNRTDQVMRGILLIMAGMLLISIQDIVIKLFSGSYTLWQIFAVRGLFALPIIASIAFYSGGVKALKDGIAPWCLVRGICVTITLLAFYAAIPFLNLATVGAANYVAPIFVTLLSAYVIGERVSRRGWLGVMIGFIGVLILLQPGTDAFSPWAMLPIMGAAFYAVGHIVTRTKCQPYSMVSLALSINIVMCLAGWMVSLILPDLPIDPDLRDFYPYLLGEWGPIPASGWGLMVILGAFAAIVGILIAGAYKIAPPSTIATYEYSYLVFVALWDYMIFGQAPGFVGSIGILCVIFAGLMVMRKK